MKRRKSLNEQSLDNDDDDDGDEKPKRIILNKSKPTFRLECYKSTVYLTVLIVLIKIFLFMVYMAFMNTHIDYDLAFFDGGNVRAEIQVLFEKYDRNDDKILDINEFEPLAHKFLARVFDFTLPFEYYVIYIF
jgi:hypothetical protein